jgi:hypothetical protein
VFECRPTLCPTEHLNGFTSNTLDLILDPSVLYLPYCSARGKMSDVACQYVRHHSLNSSDQF